MINFLRKLFGLTVQKRKMEGNDRASYILHSDDGKSYFLSKEHMNGGKFDVVLHREYIWEIDNKDIKLSVDLKQRLTKEAKQELERQGVKVDIDPPLFDIYEL